MNAPPRRRFQFSLRTMLVVVTLVCVGFGWWVHWSREWIRERQEWIEQHKGVVLRGGWGVKPPTAPCGLSLFGEHGVHIMFAVGDEEQEARRLFPEARVVLNVHVSDALESPYRPPQTGLDSRD